MDNKEKINEIVFNIVNKYVRYMDVSELQNDSDYRADLCDDGDCEECLLKEKCDKYLEAE